MYELRFSNGITLNDKNDSIYSLSIKSECSDSKLNFGTICSSSLEIKLNNTDKRYKYEIFKNTYCQLFIDDKLKYKFYVDSVTKRNGIIDIIAFDKISQLDVNFSCNTSFPISILNLLNLCLNQVGIKLKDDTYFHNCGFMVIEKNMVVGKTCRDIISLCLELGGLFGILDENEEFVCGWFDFDNIKNLDSNTFISYSSDEDNKTVSGVQFLRNNKMYNSNTYSKNVIRLTDNHPFLSKSTEEKINSVLSNISSNFTYFPCTIKASTLDKFSIGDVVSFKDEDGITRNALVSKISITNHTGINITSPDAIDIELLSEGENDVSESTGGGTISLYKANVKDTVSFSSCSEDTKILFSFTNKEGQVTSTQILEKFKDSYNVFSFECDDDSTEVDIIYMNCNIEEDMDDEIDCNFEYKIYTSFEVDKYGYIMYRSKYMSLIQELYHELAKRPLELQGSYTNDLITTETENSPWDFVKNKTHSFVKGHPNDDNETYSCMLDIHKIYPEMIEESKLLLKELKLTFNIKNSDIKFYKIVDFISGKTVQKIKEIPSSMEVSCLPWQYIILYGNNDNINTATLEFSLSNLSSQSNYISGINLCEPSLELPNKSDDGFYYYKENDTGKPHIINAIAINDNISKFGYYEYWISIRYGKPTDIPSFNKISEFDAMYYDILDSLPNE